MYRLGIHIGTLHRPKYFASKYQIRQFVETDETIALDKKEIVWIVYYMNDAYQMAISRHARVIW